MTICVNSEISVKGELTETAAQDETVFQSDV